MVLRSKWPVTILLPMGTMKSIPNGSIGLAAIAGLAIGGQNHRHLVSQPGQLDRQCAADVGQSARLGKRHRFAGGQQNIHATYLPL